MTREEAKIFLCSIAADLGFTDIENYTCKDGEKMREAIEVLSQEPTYYPPCIDCNKKMDEIRRAYDKLKEQEPKTDWIPVSERLPEEREWYLTVFKEKDTGYQLIPRVADYIGKGENKWRLIDEDGLVSEYRDLLECVAWMPLPAPFEPQESEERDDLR